MFYRSIPAALFTKKEYDSGSVITVKDELNTQHIKKYPFISEFLKML